MVFTELKSVFIMRSVFFFGRCCTVYVSTYLFDLPFSLSSLSFPPSPPPGLWEGECGGGIGCFVL